MGTVTFDLELTIERSSLKNVLRVTINAIYFQRALGVVTAKSVEVLGLTFCTIADDTIASSIDAKVDSFVKEGRNSGQILVRMSEKRNSNRRPGWFSSREEDEITPFEEWRLNITVQSGSTERDRSRIDAITKQQLAEFQFKMLSFCNNQKDHIPPITTADQQPFPIEVLISAPARQSASLENWSAGLRRLIET